MLAASVTFIITVTVVVKVKGIVTEQDALKNVSNSLNTSIETFGSQSSNLYLNVVKFFNISNN
jgi:hypothetical protein